MASKTKTMTRLKWKSTNQPLKRNGIFSVFVNNLPVYSQGRRQQTSSNCSLTDKIYYGSYAKYKHKEQNTNQIISRFRVGELNTHSTIQRQQITIWFKYIGNMLWHIMFGIVDFLSLYRTTTTINWCVFLGRLKFRLFFSAFIIFSSFEIYSRTGQKKNHMHQDPIGDRLSYSFHIIILINPVSLIIFVWKIIFCTISFRLLF